MRPLRRVFDQLERMEQLQKPQNPESDEHPDPEEHPWQRDPISMGDVLEALVHTRPSCDTAVAKKYPAWQQSYGSM